MSKKFDIGEYRKNFKINLGPDLHIHADDIVTTKKFMYLMYIKDHKYDWVRFFKTKNEAFNWYKSTT